MSKAKRRELKAKKEHSNEGSETKKSVSIQVDGGDLSQSAARDAAVVGQMLNDFPFEEKIKHYFAEAMGVFLIDLPKNAGLPALEEALSEIFEPEEFETIAENVRKSRLLVVRLKA